MKHDARGNARLILRGPVQVRVDAIDLEDANRDERSHTPVDATAHRACPRCARAKIVESAAQKWVLRLPGEADQRVSEGREFHRQRDLRAKQISMFTRASAIEFAVGSVEDGGEKLQVWEGKPKIMLCRFVLRRTLPALTHLQASDTL